MLNNWVGMGRLVRDPEKKTTASGVSVCNFTIAVDRDYRNGDEKVADFIDVTCWRGTADFVANYIAKGRMVVVHGALQSRKWEDKDGNKRINWEIQAQNIYPADSRKDNAGREGQQSTEPQLTELPADEGDLPF